MQISSSFFFGRPLPPLRPMADGHARVQPVPPVTRGDGGLAGHAGELGVGATARPSGKDSASFSSAGLSALEEETRIAAEQKAVSKDGLKVESEEATQETSAGTEELTEAEQEEVRKLKARDVEVRAHEAAHAAAAGSLASGGPSYEYQRGPDGANYAVGGEVGISLGTGSTPEERATNAARAQRAANAPANPSGQDRAVAAKAAQIAASARAEIAKAKLEEAPSGTPESTPTESAEAQASGQVPEGLTEQARAQTTQKSEQQDARKAQALQMARRTQAYRDISEATPGLSTTA